jgi:nitrile hydratase accessory protein
MQKPDTYQQQQLLQEVFSIPRVDDEPVFKQPWEAEVFAITLSLHEQGLFSWKEWSKALAYTTMCADEHNVIETEDSYYRRWLDTLENLIVSKHIANHKRLEELFVAWRNAAQSTPHGQSIEIEG